ncbi:MAG TPA: hypothetical protein ENI62_15850 [Gammaproteobacteria bacterium]|nr:hypothetical protein [Gammaproteobacteria bacterium]
MCILLVDGLNLIRRIYAGQPETTEQLKIEATATQSLRAIRKNLDLFRPSHAVLVMEYSRHNWRRKFLPTYKLDRPAMPAALRHALPDIVSTIAEGGVYEVSADGYEADDVIATLARGVVSRRGQIIILSTDRLMCQLLSPLLQVYDHFGKKMLDREFCLQRYQVLPRNLVSYFALVGNHSIGVGGVTGVGPKTAARLIAEHGGLSRILDAADQMSGRVGKVLRKGAGEARVAQRLFTLREDVRLGVNLHHFRLEKEDRHQGGLKK